MKTKYWAIIILATLAITSGLVYYIKQPALDLGPILTFHKAQSPATTTPLMELKDWKIYRNDEYGFEFRYPAEWVRSDYGNGSYFKNIDKVSVLQIDVTNQEKAQRYIVENDCPGNHTIKTSTETIYVLYCSATSEVYTYLVSMKSGEILEISYQDNFENDWSENKKIEIFRQIISSLKFIN